MKKDVENAKGMGRKMKWTEKKCISKKCIGKKWKQFSASKRIGSLLLIGTIVILSMTVGLRLWDRSRQKPRVLAALKQLAMETIEQKYSLAPLIQVIQEGNILQEGYVNFGLLERELQGLDFAWLKQMDKMASGMQYKLLFQQKEGICSSKAEYQITGIGVLDIESYLTKEKLIVRIPQLHNSYLRMSTDDIESQYKDSLLYGILGEKLVMPEWNGLDGSIGAETVPVFPQEEELKKIDLIPAFLEEYKGRLAEIWKQIQVKRESETRQVLVNGFYENCSVFHLSLPMELVQWYLDYLLPDMIKELLQFYDGENEIVDLLLYMDDEKHIHQIETVIEPEINGAVCPIKILCYLKGEAYLLDKVQVELYSEREGEKLHLRIDLEKQLEEGKRKIYVSVNQIEPEQIEQIRSNLIMDMVTGECEIEYKINLPRLVSDGEHRIRALEEPIEVPTKEMVDIFELDLIGFLKFSRDFNFGLFR